MENTHKKLIILSRDGVINQAVRDSITTPDEWVAIEGSLAALARLHQAHFRVVVATNQPGIMQGKLSISSLNAIHQKMHEQVEAAGGVIEAIFFCPHTPDAGCTCRKPSPTMLNEIAERFDVHLNEVIYVGDTINDMRAAQAAGCHPYLVLTGQGSNTYAAGDLPNDAHVRPNLAAVVKELLGGA